MPWSAGSSRSVESSPKIDSVGLTGYLFPPCSGGIGGYQFELLRRISGEGIKLTRQIQDGKLFNAYRPAWLKKLIDKFIDYNITDIEATMRVHDESHQAIPYLRFVGRKDEFVFKLQLHFDGLPRYFWSGSLFNFYTGSYTDIDKSIDNRSAFNLLLKYLKSIKFTFLELLELDPDREVRDIGHCDWYLHRLDIATDYKLGLDNVLRSLDVIGNLKVPGYRAAKYSEYYKAVFVPVMKEHSNKRLALPTINVYSKSHEVVSFFGDDDKISIPDTFLEDGWLRMELQFYQSGRYGKRADLQSEIMRKLKKAIQAGEFTDRQLEEVFRQFDVITPRVFRGEMSPLVNRLMRRINTLMMHNHGTFTMRYLEELGRFTGEEMKTVKRIVAGLLGMESIRRKGQRYYCNDTYLQQLSEGGVAAAAAVAAGGEVALSG